MGVLSEENVVVIVSNGFRPKQSQVKVFERPYSDTNRRAHEFTSADSEGTGTHTATSAHTNNTKR